MHVTTAAPVGHFCWLDLAAADLGAAQVFYRDLFGWQPEDRAVSGGHLTRLLLDGAAVGSMYQLRPRHLRDGVPSHWTPYIAVADADDATGHARALGGRVVVPPFDVPGLARVGLVLDPAGALFGVWQRGNVDSGQEETAAAPQRSGA